ncbi:DUF2079 domain-containing protein [Hymenobacter sp. BRD128]|uniref:DUF2079 domain-containing protein n=1 Tax=Hymenobacter sp. BRD128 TaxID=2675878 RepID=UPI0015657B97|nr:DUF2079 domain-containing protein [Hymenobacter sp. BRD128]QKG58351.1 DUF2079 domain-containing protein [Hymenobacter sp. BRD128]
MPATALPALRVRPQLALLLLFTLIYSLVSLVNQVNFRTGALDMGYEAQAVTDFAHLRAPRVTLLPDAPPTAFLANHFSLTPALAVPLYYLVGPVWALLLLQIGALLVGLEGARRYARSVGASEALANWALAFLGSQWALFSALGFDFHDNVLVAMVLPWLARWVAQGRWGRAGLAAAFSVLSKENLALWLAFVLLGLAWQHWPRRAVVWRAAVGVVLALGYFVAVTRYLMPALDTTHRPYTQLARYGQFGSSLPGIAGHLLTHPGVLWNVLFTNTLPDTAYDYIKLELWVGLLLSGGWALPRRPWYALMLVPIIGQKVLANDAGFWGINYQYSVEIAPVLTLAVADALASRRPASAHRWLWALAGVVLFTVVTLYTRRSTWYDRSTTNFLIGSHYRPAYADRAALRAALARVPAGVPLSASSTLVPHLTDRRNLFLFPVLRTARLVALLREPDERGAWPLSPAEGKRAAAQLCADPSYRVLYEDARVVLLARQFAPPDSAASWRP